ncbi:uncharacterized protein LOC133904550, partial [Phragmites australis]|uniref:uncharacterized protein LOC133904550 n=1 Tax=Phragmites australis TaxID=29695 RepID=UPI002D77DA75
TEKGTREDKEDSTRVVNLSRQKEDFERSLQDFKKIAQEQINARVEELKKAEMDARAASLELELKVAVATKGELEADAMVKKREYDLVKGENGKLRSEVLIAEKKHSMSEVEIKRLMIKLGVLVVAKEVAAKAFDAEKAEIMKELEELKSKVEEIQASKETTEGAGRETDA